MQTLPARLRRSATYRNSGAMNSLLRDAADVIERLEHEFLNYCFEVGYSEEEAEEMLREVKATPVPMVRP